MPALSSGEECMMMSRPITLFLLLCLAGCDATDPYSRPGVWRPSGANDANLRAMVAAPSDLALAPPASPADGALSVAALARLRQDRVRPLLNSGLARITPVDSGSPAAAPAAPPPGAGQ
jgi:hypothetical protein